MSPHPPRISVIMCAYNGGAFIRKALDCMLAQTFTDWELIISDDGSNDGTRDWLATLKDPRIRLFLQEKNLGYVPNKNFAHAQATGEWVTQLDNDDLCHPDRLRLQWEAAHAHPEAGMIACGYHRIDEHDRIYETVQGGGNRLITRREDPYPFWFPSLFLRRSLFEETGPFPPYFAGIYGDDAYWTVRAHLKTPIYYIDQPLYSYRNNPHSITNVLSRERELVVPGLMRQLLHQLEATGSSWIERGETDELRRYEKQLMQDKAYLSEQYRIWAAKATDKGHFGQAKTLLRKAVALRPLRMDHLRTCIYLLRALIRRPSNQPL